MHVSTVNEQPLIVTLQLDREAQQYFNQLRKQYFPPAINYIDAHITLFHKLPYNEPLVTEEIENSARIKSFAVTATEVYHTGFGVAIRLESKPLLELQRHLREKFHSFLTPQDRQPFRPHVTIQNKVSAAVSKQLSLDLQATFRLFTATAIGINLWTYENGPWKHQEFFAFDVPV